MEVDDPAQFPVWRAIRRKFPLHSPFFNAGNLERELLAKQVSLEITEEEKHQISRLEEEQCWETLCPVVGCKARLRGLEGIEAHYVTRHTAFCSVCSHVFPTIRLLNIHVAEAHDSFFQAKAAHGHPMYECLVEGCGSRFQSNYARHQHLVDKHKFPQTFSFHKKRHLSQKQRHRLRAKHGSQEYQAPKQAVHIKQDESPCQKDTDNLGVQMDIDKLTSAVSRLSTADHGPLVVSFGRKHNKGFAFPPRTLRGGRSQSNQKTDKP